MLLEMQELATRHDHPVFANISYDYMTHEKCKRIFAAAGLSAALTRGATFHSLRHTFASEFMRQGGNIYTLQKLLGHSTVLQTERYAHFAAGYLAGETERLSWT